MICASCKRPINLSPKYHDGSTHLVELKITAFTAVGGDGYAWTKVTEVGAVVFCGSECLAQHVRMNPVKHARPAGNDVTAAKALCGAEVSPGIPVVLFDQDATCTRCREILGLARPT